MYFIGRYGQFEEGHHKAWVLDQVARIILGCEITVVLAQWENGHEEYRVSTGVVSNEYTEWQNEMNDPDYLEYDKGIPP